MLTPVTSAVGTATANLHLHQPPPPPLNRPLSAHSTKIGSVKGNGREDERPIGSNYRLFDSVFGNVPSRIEVLKAMHDLQSFMFGLHRPEFNWFQQMLNHNGPRMLQSLGYGRVDDAFSLLQTDRFLQRMVMSIATDKAVWDAILNNRTVQDLRQSLFPETNAEIEGIEPQSSTSTEEFDLASHIVKWILDFSKAMILELIEKFRSLVNDLFQTPDENKHESEPAVEIATEVDGKLKSSLILSIVILLIVIVSRASGA